MIPQYIDLDRLNTTSSKKGKTKAKLKNLKTKTKESGKCNNPIQLMYSKYVSRYLEKRNRKTFYWHLYEIYNQVFNFACAICYI